MCVSKLVNPSTTSSSYHIFMSIGRRIPDELSEQRVDEALMCYVVCNHLKILQINYPQILGSQIPLKWTLTDGDK